MATETGPMGNGGGVTEMSATEIGKRLAQIYLRILAYGQPNTQPIAHPINTADETAPRVRPADEIEAQDE